MGFIDGLVVPQGRENQMLWDRSPGHAEVWYFTVNVPQERTAFWLRYTLDAPLPGKGEPRCELWAHAFFGDDPAKSFGGKSEHGIDALGTEGIVTVGDGRLAEGRLSGAVEAQGRRIAWDLWYPPSVTSVHTAPRLLRALHLIKTEFRLPNVAARFSGTVEVDGRKLALDGAPGHEGHIYYGKKHAEAWTWLHCSAWDGGEDATVDVISAFLRKAQPRPVTSVYLRVRGEDVPLATAVGLLTTKGGIAFPRFTLRGGNARVLVEGRASFAPERALQVLYADADGEESWCANSEIADCELALRWADGRRETLTATGTANLEFGAREPFAGVRRTV